MESEHSLENLLVKSVYEDVVRHLAVRTFQTMNDCTFQPGTQEYIIAQRNVLDAFRTSMDATSRLRDKMLAILDEEEV